MSNIFSFIKYFVLRESFGIVQLHKVGNVISTKFLHHYCIMLCYKYWIFNDNNLSFLYSIDMEECRMAVYDDKLLTLILTKLPRIGLPNAILKSVQWCCQDMLRTMSQEFDTQLFRTLAKFYKVVFNDNQLCDRNRKAL